MDQKDIVKNFKKYEDVVAACNRCGFCTSYCPTYNATGSESQSPRGRNQMFRALLEGRLEDPLQAKESIDTCLLCGECTSVCFSEVPTAQLMIHARDLINQSQGIPKELNFFLQHILPNPRTFSKLLKIMFLGKNLGVAFLLDKLGILKKFAPTLSNANKLVKHVPLKFLLDYKEVSPYREEWYEKREQGILSAQQELEKLKRDEKPVSDSLTKKAEPFLKRPKIAYMLVCGSQYLQTNIGVATFILFKKLGLEFMIPKISCCGLPAASYGVTERVRFMAQQNIMALERGNYDGVVIDDSSCAAHMKEMSVYFRDDKEWLSRAHAMSQKIRELSSFLIQRGLPEQLKKKSWLGGAVAYHDPCKAQYGQKMTQPPRDLLSAIPRLKLMPITDADQCCGGGGTYSFVHPELSKDVLSAKIKNIVATGCRIVVTSSTSCLIQLTSGLKNIKPHVEVLHLSEFLVRALEHGK